MPRQKDLAQTKIYRFHGKPVANILGWESRRSWGKGKHEFTMLPQRTDYLPKSAQNFGIILFTKDHKPLHGGLRKVKTREHMMKDYAGVWNV